jgi:predicted DNA-binding transcriptional regulator YafY
MYHPTTRLLTILELLQTHPTLSGDALARRLEVEPRSVRRYITMLQDMGMPIEAVRGPGGGYALRPGFKLPPLLFSEEEATAIVLGLLSTEALAIDQPAMAVAGALAKVMRVLPIRARERLGAVAASLVVAPSQQASQPAAGLLLDLSEAIQLGRRVALDYQSQHGEHTHRTVEPYGLAGWWGHWYLVGYCCLRKGLRMFRLDRIDSLHMTAEAFTRPEDFDIQEYLRTHLAGTSSRWQIAIEFQAPLERVRQKIPASYGTLSETPGGTLFQTDYGQLSDIARFLVHLNMPFVVHTPPELRAELLALAERIAQGAAAPGSD